MPKVMEASILRVIQMNAKLLYFYPSKIAGSVS